jgi:hypothetical protein
MTSLHPCLACGGVPQNNPSNRAIAVLNLAMGKPTASWPVGYDSNFPMALDGNAKQLS